MNVEYRDKIDDNYDNLVKKTKKTTFFQSLKHIRFLEDTLQLNAKCIVATEKNEVIGTLPFFSKKTDYGNVFNSLPFFGSYGGIITTNDETYKKILEKFNNHIDESDVLSSTIITNPFTSSEVYGNFYNHNHIEQRLIQCTTLNQDKNQMWKSLEKRVRWSINKSKNNDISVSIINSDQKLIDHFYQLHKNSMDAKKGKPKPKSLFSSIQKCFEQNLDYDIFVAKKDDNPIGYVLVFYFNQFTEYYMPAYDPEFRNLQSTSHLIWESMLKSIDLNKKYFNFGGTWPNQENLFRFKRGWNADNFYYNYFIKCDIERLKNIKIEDFPKIFQDFYVCPYNLLKE